MLPMFLAVRGPTLWLAVGDVVLAPPPSAFGRILV